MIYLLRFTETLGTPRHSARYYLGLMTLAYMLTLTACGDGDSSAVQKLMGGGASQPTSQPAPAPPPTPHLWPTEQPTVAPMPIQIAAPEQPAPQPTAQSAPQPQSLAVIPTPYTQPDMPLYEPCPVLDNGRIDPACTATWRR